LLVLVASSQCGVLGGHVNNGVVGSIAFNDALSILATCGIEHHIAGADVHFVIYKHCVLEHQGLVVVMAQAQQSI